LASTLAAAIHAAAASPPTTGSDGTARPGTRNPSRQHVPGPHDQARDRPTHALDIGHVHTASVHLDRWDEHHVIRQRVPANQRKQPFPLLSVSFFESSAAEGFQSVRAKHAGRDDQWARAGAATHFVDARHRTKTAAIQRRLQGAQP
jgi:hypothetical protein